MFFFVGGGEQQFGMRKCLSTCHFDGFFVKRRDVSNFSVAACELLCACLVVLTEQLPVYTHKP